MLLKKTEIMIRYREGIGQQIVIYPDISLRQEYA